MKTKRTSGILIFLAVFLLVLVGCEQPVAEPTPEPDTSQTLTIKNESFFGLSDFKWHGHSFEIQGDGILNPGDIVELTVTEEVASSGSGYLFFTRNGVNSMKLRTDGVYTFNENEDLVITFIDHTPVVDSEKNSNTGTLESIKSIPEIEVWVNNRGIAKGETISFSDTEKESSSELVFTVKNIGSGNLSFNDNEAIKLTGDSNFSVEQPKNSTIPQEGLSFSISFSPTDVKTFSGHVLIETNASNDSSFEFNISGKGIPLTDKTVTFDTRNDTISDPDPMTVEHGKTLPSLPDLEGRFIGWFFVEDGIEKEFKSTTSVIKNLTVYAKWSIEYIVSFISGMDDVVNPTSIDVWAGDTIPVLPVCEKQYYAFIGWFLTSDSDDEFTTNTPVNSDITVYGKWRYGTLPAPSLEKTISGIFLRWTPPLGTKLAVIYRKDENNSDGYKIGILQKNDGSPLGDGAEYLFSDFSTDETMTYWYDIENQTYDEGTGSWHIIATEETVSVTGVYNDEWIHGSSTTVTYNASSSQLSFSPALPVPNNHPSAGNGKILLEFNDRVTTEEVVLEGPLSHVNLKNSNKLKENVPYEIISYVPIYHKVMGTLEQYYYLGTDIKLTGKTTGIIIPTESPPPLPPQNVSAVAISSSTINVTWDSVSGADSYTVYYRKAYTGDNYEPVNLIRAGTTSSTSCAVRNLSPSTMYLFWVTASNTGSESVYSLWNYALTESVALSAPTALSATYYDSTRDQLTWNAVSGATEYEVWRSTKSDLNTAKVYGTTTSSAPGCLVPNSDGESYYYYYWIKAKNGSTTSGFSSDSART